MPIEIMMTQIHGSFWATNLVDPKNVKEQIKRAVRKVTNEEGKIQKGYLDRLTRSWDVPEPVDFEVETSETADTYTVTIKTDNRFFRYLEEGTQVRYATMSSDFRPRTRFGSVVSGGKKGGLMYVNTKKPRPGIEPRMFLFHLANLRRGIFNKKHNDATQKILRRYFGWGM